MQSASNPVSSEECLFFKTYPPYSHLSVLSSVSSNKHLQHRTTIAFLSFSFFIVLQSSLLAHNGQRFSSELLLHTHIMSPSIQRIVPIVPVNRANRALQQSPQEPMHIREQLMLVHLHAHPLDLLLAGLLPKPRLEVGLHEIALLLRVRMPFQPQNVRIGEVVVRHPLAEVVGDIRSHGDLARVSTHSKNRERATRSPRRSCRRPRCAECCRAADRDVRAPLRTLLPPLERTCCRFPAESGRFARF